MYILINMYLRINTYMIYHISYMSYNIKTVLRNEKQAGVCKVDLTTIIVNSVAVM